MSDVMVSAVVGCFAAILASLTTYLVARRSHSGSVDTTEAAQLWAESQAMRKDLRDEALQLRQEVERWRRAAEESSRAAEKYSREASKLRIEVIGLRSEVAKLQAALDRYRPGD